MIKKHIIVLAGSQLFGTSPADVSVSEFAQVTGLSETYVKWCMLYDQYLASCNPCSGGSYINQYKQGMISDDEFYQGIRQRLGKVEDELSNDNIKNCWNKMCEFSHNTQTEVKEFISFLAQNPDYVVFFVNETNPLHYKFNRSQLRALVGDEAFELVEDRIRFVNSFEECSTNKADLAKKAITSYLKINGTNIDAIGSLHSAMPAEDLLEKDGTHAAAVRRPTTMNYKTMPSTVITNALQEIHGAFGKVLDQKYSRAL